MAGQAAAARPKESSLVALAVASAGVLLLVAAAGVKPGLLPDPIGEAGLARLLGIALVAIGALLHHRGLKSKPAANQEASEGHSWRAAIALGTCAAWNVAIPVLGFTVPTAVALASMSATLGLPWKRSVVAGVVGGTIAFLIFNRFFAIRVPMAPVDLFISALIPQFRL